MRAIGITGQMGTGKSWLADNFAEYLRQRNLPVRIVSIDEIRRHILTHSAQHQALREGLSKHFGVPLTAEGAFDLQQLTQTVFGSDNGAAEFWAIAGKEIVGAAAMQMQGEGVRLLEWSRLMEDGFLPLVERVIVTSCAADVQRQRLAGGDLPAAQVEKRLSLQMTTEEIAAALEKTGVKFRIFDTTVTPAQGACRLFCDEVLHDAA